MARSKKAFISGIGELKPQLHSNIRTLDLLAGAATLAIQDAGLK